jgi:predicted phage terminase large subunit-like protein
MSIPFLTPRDWQLADAVWGFARKYLVARYDEPKPIPDVHREWWALCMSPHPQVAIAAPRGHAKSTCITFAYVLFELLTKRMSHLLLLGSNESLASAFLYDIKTELNENEALRKDFGIERLLKETETEIICELAGGHKFRLIAKGAGQRMRGLKWERKRPDSCVFDDMEDEDMVLNEARREKFRRWFYGTVRPILRGGGRIRGVGTIIGFDSLLERMMPNPKDKATVIEPLRVYSKEPKGWASIKYRAHSHDFAQILWPEQRNAEELKKIRSEYAAMGMLDIYGQEYLNDPIDNTTAYFRQQDFLAMRPADRETRKTYYVGIDLAIGESDRNAYTVMVVGGMDIEGTLHVVDVRRDRIDGLQIMEEMFSIYDRWHPDTYRTESENIEKAIGSFMNREMDERQKYLNLDPRPPTVDKDKRAQSIRARMRAGKVRFDKEAEWYADFEEELLKYPKAPFKDQVDAFAWLGLMLEEMVEPQSDREIEDEEYMQAFEQHTAMGRNQVTGY